MGFNFVGHAIPFNRFNNLFTGNAKKWLMLVIFVSTLFQGEKKKTCERVNPPPVERPEDACIDTRGSLYSEQAFLHVKRAARLSKYTEIHDERWTMDVTLERTVTTSLEMSWKRPAGVEKRRVAETASTHGLTDGWKLRWRVWGCGGRRRGRG